MSKLAHSAILVVLLASCSGEPFDSVGDEPAGDGESTDGGTDGGIDTPDVGDGSGVGTDVPDSGASQSLRALYGGEVNSVEYDPDTGEVVINNLPLDGQSYHEFDRGLDGFQAITNSEDALRRYYAVRRTTETGDVEVTAVGTGDYRDTGYGGYLIRRASDTANLPATGEAVYQGPYAGVRVLPGDQQGTRNATFSQGDATLEVDFGDFDVVGAVEGRIENRKVVGINGEDLGERPVIILGTGEIEGNGRFSGAAFTEPDATEGSYVGLFAGPDGEEAGGVVLIDDAGWLERGVFTAED